MKGQQTNMCMCMLKISPVAGNTGHRALPNPLCDRAYFQHNLLRSYRVWSVKNCDGVLPLRQVK